jgi:membrane-associated protein
MSSLLAWIIAFGYIGIFITVFAESGFLLGFFLPGDSLLFSIGLLAVDGHLNIVGLLFLVILGAILGDSFGYYLGRRFGPTLFNRPDSWLFKRSYADETKLFFEKYGKKSIVLARFVPVVRTFTPVMAGIGAMDYSAFLVYNIVGGVLWGGGLLLLSYFAGATIPGIQRYTGLIIVLIIVVSFLPVMINLFKRFRQRSR